MANRYSCFTVYGKRPNGEEKVLFRDLENAAGAVARGKKTIAENGYTVTKVMRIDYGYNSNGIYVNRTPVPVEQF